VQLLSSLPIGATVHFHNRDWLVAAQDHPGYPSGSTTLIVKTSVDSMMFDNVDMMFDNVEPELNPYTGNNRYLLSNLRQWLNASGNDWYEPQHEYDTSPDYAVQPGFLGRFSSNDKKIIEPTTVKTQFEGGSYDYTEDYFFLMSAKEAGITSFGWMGTPPNEGESLPLFPDAESRRIPALPNRNYWLRTLSPISPGLIIVDTEDGSVWGSFYASDRYSVRPLVNIAAGTMVEPYLDKYKIVYPHAPVVESIILPEIVQADEPFTVSWTASDIDDDIILYRVEKTVVHEGVHYWEVFYEGSDTSITDMVPRHSMTYVGYRVSALDAEGWESEVVSASAGVNNGDSFYNSDLAGPDDIAIGKTTAELKNPNTYVGWDFDDVWAMEPGQYPYLKNVAYPTHGTLVDENNQPLVGAIISCGEARAITGLDGKFTIMLTVGQQKLFIEHPEYPPEEPIIDVPPPGPEGVPGHIIIPITIPFVPGQGAIRGLWRYADHKIFVHGNKIYKLIEGEEPEAIYSGISDVDCDGFAFGGKLYIVNGHEFLCYDGEAVYEPEPYVPTVRINAPPAGGGEEYEQFNLLTGKFKQTFIPDGNSNQFHLLFGDLDDVEVTGEHLDKELKEGVHFTVNKLTGVINTNGGSDPLGVPADSGGLATLSFVASKTNPEDRVKVIKNNRASIYGANNSIIHLYGNPDYPNRVIRSEAADPTYWPENTYTDFGASSSKVTGKVNQYGVSLVLKEREIYQEQYALRDDGTHAFRVETLNAKTGCVAPGSVAIAGDNAIFLSERGVHQVVSTNVENERNAPVISEKVNRDLLRRNLETAKAIVHGDHYLLHFPDDGFAWVYNYTTGSWVAWDSFRANCFLVDGHYLYFGGLDDGLVHRFKQSTDGSPYNDNGQPIRAEFHTKAFDFNYPSVYKMLRAISIGLRPGGDVSADVDYRTDKDAEWLPLFNASQTYSGVFMFSRLVFSRWKFGANPLPKTIRRRMNAKKLTSVQLRIKNDALNESMGLLFVELEYALQRRVR
jgi:hypothetical protein